MAEDFRALIEAQKETTRALLKGEQQAEMDAANSDKMRYFGDDPRDSCRCTCK